MKSSFNFPPYASGVSVAALVTALAIGGCGPAVDDTSVDPVAIFEAPRPHVIFITMDTTRADWLGCYGHPWIETPNIDAFADESILYERCMSPAPSTLAAHTAMFTGKYPHTNGVPENGYIVPAKNQLLAETLRDLGYQTAAAVSSAVLGNLFAIGQGIDHFDEDMAFGRDWKDTPIARKAEHTTDSVIQYLDTLDPADPLFLWVHYWDPHLPYRAPPEHRAPYAEVTIDPRTIVDHWKVKNAGIRTFPRQFRGPNLQAGLRGYAAEITYMDAEIGRLFEYLKRRGYYDDAIVVLTADHGETLWDHAPYFSHSVSLFDDTIRVPAIVRQPGAKHAGTRIATPISSMDFTPSILEYLGASGIEVMESRPLHWLAGSRELDSVPLFAEGTRPHTAMRQDARWINERMGKAVFDGRYKFIMRPYIEDFEAGRVEKLFAAHKPVEELFDLQADPRESTDLLQRDDAETRAVAERLRAALAVWSDSAEPLPLETMRERMEETMEMLRALGYLN